MRLRLSGFIYATAYIRRTHVRKGGTPTQSRAISAEENLHYSLAFLDLFTLARL